MPHFQLSPVEARILGCLMEKERLTPENYPLSLHSLTAACNQSTNRDPVTVFDEREVDDALLTLREKRLATMIHAAGSRVSKYRHNLPDHYDFTPREAAVICTLLLRGPQTPGELRARTERMHPFSGIEEVEACLAELAAGDPLVRMLPARPGQKERRYAQLLAGEPVLPEPLATSRGEGEEIAPARPSRLDEMEKALAEPLSNLDPLLRAETRAELSALREEFAAFRKQFE